METQTKLGGLGPPRSPRTATSELPPEGAAFEARPYLFMGLGTRRWVRYRLHDGRATVDRLRPPASSRSVELRGARIEVRRSWFGDRGSIRIVARDGQVLEWKALRELSFVAALLTRAAHASSR